MTHHVFLTGASTGIGFATATLLQGHGLNVIAGVRNRQDADRIEKEIGCRTCLLDVTAPYDVKSAGHLARDVLKDGGTLSLVNNAGIAVGGPLECVPDTDFRRQIDVNVVGLFAMTQALLPMIRETKGRVINMSSIAGRLASPFLAPYAASKHAVEALTDSLRREVAPFSVHVVSINPGVIRTPIWDKSIDPLEERYLNQKDASSAPYRERMIMLKDLVAESVRNGAGPEDVAEAVHHGLTAAKPKTRYYVGKGVGRTALFTRLLPDRWIDKMTARRFEN